MVKVVNNFPAIVDAFRTALSQTVRKVAFDGLAAAQSNAAVDTGFMKNSGYVVTAKDSTYSSIGHPVAKEGEHGPDNVDSYALPEFAPPTDEYTAYVCFAANYSIYVEMGTHRAPAQPFLGPGMESVRPAFEAALAAIEAKLKEVA